MEIAIIYILVYALLAVILLSVIINIKKQKTDGKTIRTGTIVGIVLVCMITIWISSHKSYPLINDWAFLGRDITVIEQKYKTFKSYSTREDGSGYAVLKTEQITGIKMYDSGDYSCYFMEFDKTGKIIKVYCSRPFGG